MGSLKSLLMRPSTGSILVLAAILLVAFPLTLDIFRLNLVGKYLTYAFVAIGLVMLWGHAGILSLGQINIGLANLGLGRRRRLKDRSLVGCLGTSGIRRAMSARFSVPLAR